MLLPELAYACHSFFLEVFHVRWGIRNMFAGKQLVDDGVHQFLTWRSAEQFAVRELVAKLAEPGSLLFTQLAFAKRLEMIVFIIQILQLGIVCGQQSEEAGRQELIDSVLAGIGQIGKLHNLPSMISSHDDSLTLGQTTQTEGLMRCGDELYARESPAQASDDAHLPARMEVGSDLVQ